MNMAKIRKVKNSAALKKLAVIGAVLIVAQAGFIYFYSDSAAPKSAHEAITKAVDGKGMTASKAAQAKVQTAVMAYRVKNKKFPDNLQQLVPQFLDKVPVDPATKKQIAYQVVDGRAIVGSTSGTAFASNEMVKSGDESITRSEQEALIASLEDSASRASYIYTSEDKRDPFLPFDFSPKFRPGATPLERYTFDQLKVSAILLGGDEPVAMIDDAAGKSHPARKGTKIGPLGGEVVDIQPDFVVVIEVEEDFTGEKRSRTVELPLRRPGPASRQ